jgi:colicin import membrane protein
MLAVSLLLHGLLFSSLFWVPGSSSMGGLGIGEKVYEVSLVEGPQSGDPSVAAQADTGDKTTTAQSENKQAKRISKLPSKKNAVTIAKRTVEKSKSKADSAQDANNLLDKAISKIKSGSASKNAENSNHLEKAIAAMRKSIGSGATSGGGGSGGGGAGGGDPALRIYQMEVEVLIKSNWSFPDALANNKNIEAVVLLKVTNDGTVTAMDLIRPSGNSIFDQSVLKAIEKSKPLPHLPEGYKKRNEELEINFNLKDLE